MEYIPAKTIVTATKSREWFGIDYNMNIYRGCCHGCIYCDSRSDCYQIKDFDQIRAKKMPCSSSAMTCDVKSGPALSEQVP